MPLLILACSHEWDAYDPRGGPAPTGGAAGAGGAAPDAGTGVGAGPGTGGGGGVGEADAGLDADAGGDAAEDAGPTHVTQGLVALYTFEEGAGATVHDVSNVAPALDLTIDDTGAVTWIPGALSIVAPTLISSPGPALKVFEACQATDQITLEVWLDPALAEQGGPARLISSSVDTGNRNFHLGQELASYYQARLRSTASLDNNGAPHLQTPTDAGQVKLELTHLLFTRDAGGVRRLYVNAVEEAMDTLGGDFTNWDPTYPLLMANELTLDRAWLGELHRIAVYNRALSAAEVEQNYTAGP